MYFLPSVYQSVILAELRFVDVDNTHFGAFLYMEKVCLSDYLLKITF